MAERTDRASDPRILDELLIARRGQAFFSRQLRTLRDRELAGASGVPGWSRAHVVAYVALSARAITRLTEWAVAGSGAELWSDRTERQASVDFSSTLPVEALRSLSEHSAVHLDVEWRDLPAELWDATCGGGSLGPIGLRETPLLRARQVWLGALALDAGATGADIPAEVLRVLDLHPGVRAPFPRDPERWP